MPELTRPQTSEGVSEGCGVPLDGVTWESRCERRWTCSSAYPSTLGEVLQALAGNSHSTEVRSSKAQLLDRLARFSPSADAEPHTGKHA